MDYDTEVIEAYDFMLPVILESYSSPLTLTYVIPKENENFLGGTRKRMHALKPALDMVRKRRHLLREIKSYESEVANAGNWWSSSVLMSEEHLQSIADSTNKLREKPLQKIKELRLELTELEADTRHKIRMAFSELD